MFHSKVVVRAGGGIYYDRGELFSYFSPGYAIGTVTGGPFGVNQQLPFVNASSCPDCHRCTTLRGLHSDLRRIGSPDADRQPRESLRHFAARTAQQSQGFGSGKITCPTRGSIVDDAASRFRSVSTTAPTSCPTP